MAEDKADGGIWADAKAFRRRVRMPAAQVASLTAGELARALAYEVEPFSGIPAETAETAWKEIPGDDRSAKTYDVAVRRRGGGSGGGGPCARFARLGAVLLAIAAAGVAVDATIASRNLSSLEREAGRRREIESNLRSLADAARAARDRADALRRGREETARAQRKAAALRAAHSEIMSVVANVCGGRVVVKSFKSPEPFALEFQAAAADAGAASETLANLAPAAAAAGWTLSSGTIDSRAGGATVDFSFSLKLREGDAK